MKCPNKTHPDWKALVEEFGEGEAYLRWEFINNSVVGKGLVPQIRNFEYDFNKIPSENLQDYINKVSLELQAKFEKLYPEININITDSPQFKKEKNVLNQEKNNKLYSVDYTLSIISALDKFINPIQGKRFRKYKERKGIARQTLRLNTKERPNLETNLRKSLNGKGVTNQQIDLLFDYMKQNNLKEISVEDAIKGLQEQYKFDIEINTAKEKLLKQLSLDSPESFIDDFGNDYTRNYSDTHEGFDYFKNGNIITKQQFEKDYQNILERVVENNPTQHYSILSAPGSTKGKNKYEDNPDWEYRELTIQTPDIINSNSKHTQDFSNNISNMLGWIRIWYNKKTGVVEIQEIQSALFQEGRDRKDLIAKVENETFRKLPDNQFLQLLNKKNNWVTFFVKSIIQDSAKKGYEKVLFPKGETAAKIEGHQTLEEFKKQKESRIKELGKEIENSGKINDSFENNGIEYFIKTPYGKTTETTLDNEGNYTTKNVTTYFKIDNTTKEGYLKGKQQISASKYRNAAKEAGVIIDYYKLSPEQIVNKEDEIKTLKQELADVESGQTQLSSIANFYENTVTNILKKQGYNPVEITDEYGNTWNEISINQDRDLANILLQRNEANQIIGQANIKAMTVLIDTMNQKLDTLPHEYAHHYIAWFRDTPIVQKAIKKWGSEENLVQAIGEEVVKRKGEAYGWWKKFTKWLLNILDNLSSAKKEELVSVLTDAFLTRTDLRTGKTLERVHNVKDLQGNNVLNQEKNYKKDKQIQNISEEIQKDLKGTLAVKDIQKIIESLANKNITPKEFVDHLINVKKDKNNFHAVIRVLSENQRYVTLINLAFSKYGSPTLQELQNIAKNSELENLDSSQLSMLYFEDKMANDYINYKKGKRSKPKGMLGRTFDIIDEMSELALEHTDKLIGSLEILKKEVKTNELFDIIKKKSYEPVSKLLKSPITKGTPITREESNNLVTQIAHEVLNSIEENINDLKDFDRFFNEELVKAIYTIKERYSWEGTEKTEGWKYKIKRKYQGKTDKTSVANMNKILKKIQKLESVFPSNIELSKNNELLIDKNSSKILKNNLLTIVKEVKKYTSFHISRFMELENIDEQESNEDIQGETWNMAQYEEGGYNRIPDKLKALISRATVFIDEFGLGKYLENGVSKKELENYERYQKPVNAIIVYNVVIKILSDTEKGKMLSKLKDYIEYSDNVETKKFMQFFTRVVANEVNNKVKNPITPEDVLNANEEYSVFLAQKSPSLNLLMRAGHGTMLKAEDVLLDNKNGLYKIVNSSKNDVEEAQVYSWRSNMESKNVSLKSFTTALDEIELEINTLFEDEGGNVYVPSQTNIMLSVNKIHKLFDSVGLTFSKTYIKYSIVKEKMSNIEKFLEGMLSENMDIAVSQDFLNNLNELRELANRYDNIPHITLDTIQRIRERSSKLGKPTLIQFGKEEKDTKYSTDTRYLKMAEGNAFFDETVSPSSYMNIENETVQAYSPAFYYSDKITELNKGGENSLRELLLDTIINLRYKYNDIQEIPEKELQDVLEKIRNYGEINNPMPSNLHEYITLNILMHDSLFDYSGKNKNPNKEMLEVSLSFIELSMFGGGRQQAIQESEEGVLETLRARTFGKNFAKLNSSDKLLMEMILYDRTVSKNYNNISLPFNKIRMAVNSEKRRQFSVLLPKINSFEKEELTNTARKSLRNILKQEYEIIRTLYNTEGLKEIPKIYEKNETTGEKSGLALNFKRFNSKSISLNLETLKDRATLENVPFDKLDETFINETINSFAQDLGISLLDLMTNELSLLQKDSKEDFVYYTESLPAGYKIRPNGKKVDINKILDFAIGSFINRTSIMNLVNLGSHFVSYTSPRNEVKRISLGSAQGNDMGFGKTILKLFNTVEKTIEPEESERHGFDNNGELIDSTDGITYTNLEWFINTFLTSEGASESAKKILRKIRKGVFLTDAEHDYIYKEKAIPQSLKLQINSAYVGIKTSVHILDRTNVSYQKEETKKEMKEFFDAWEELESNVDNFSYKGKNSSYKGYTLEQFRRESIDFFRAIPGREELHQRLNDMYLGNYDMQVASSASKKPLSENEVVSVTNKLIRKQVETSGQKNEIRDPTQKRHLIVSEIAKDAKIMFKNIAISGKEAVRFYKRVLATRTEMGIEEKKQFLLNEFGVNDYQFLLSEFSSIIEKTGQSPYLLEMFSLEEGMNKPKYELNIPSVSTKFEAMFLSLFSKDTMIAKAPGTKFVLVPDLGYSKISYRDEIITTKEFLKLSQKEKEKVVSGGRLKHRVLNEDGNYYSEAVVSESFAKIFGLKIGGIVPAKLLKFAGVRIPTQDNHSMVNVRVVDVISSSSGNTIILPFELVGLSGWDFDIDAFYARTKKIYHPKGDFNRISIYGDYLKMEDSSMGLEMAYEEYMYDLAENNPRIKKYMDIKNLNKNKLEDIQKALDYFTSVQNISSSEFRINPFNEELALENIKAKKEGKIYNIVPLTKNEANNLLLDMEIGLLHNDKNKEISATPATRKDLQRIKDLYIQEGIRSENDVEEAVSAHNIIKLDKENSIGQTNVGIIALFNVTMQYLVNKKFKNDFKILGKDSFELTIGQNGEVYTHDVNNNLVRLNDIISQLVTAMVDAPTHGDPGFFNITKDSLNVISLLLGTGHSLDFAINFVNQPAIRAYSEKIIYTESVLVKTEFKKSLIYERVVRDMKLKEKPSFDFTEKNLFQNLISPEDSLQLGALNSYLEILAFGTEMLPFNAINSTMSNGTGKNLAESYNTKLKIQKIINDELPFSTDKILDDNPHLEAQIEAVEEGDTINKRFMLGATDHYTEMLDSVRNSISEISSNINNGEQRLRNALTSFLFIQAINHKGYIENNEELLFTEDLHNDILELQTNPSFKDNKLLKYLNLTKLKFERGSLKGKTLYDITINTRRKEEANTINLFMDAFSEMYYSEFPRAREIAKKLKDFLLIRDAFLFKSGTFITSIEPQILKVDGIFDITSSVFDLFKKETIDLEIQKLYNKNKGELTMNFSRMFLRASENKNLVSKIHRRTLSKLKTKTNKKFFTISGNQITMNYNLSKEASEKTKNLFGKADKEKKGSLVPMVFSVFQSREESGSGLYVLSKVTIDKNGKKLSYNMNDSSDYLKLAKIFPNGKIYATYAEYQEKPTLGSKRFTPYYFSEEELNNLSLKTFKKVSENKNKNLEITDWESLVIKNPSLRMDILKYSKTGDISIGFHKAVKLLKDSNFIKSVQEDKSNLPLKEKIISKLKCT